MTLYPAITLISSLSLIFACPGLECKRAGSQVLNPVVNRAEDPTLPKEVISTMKLSVPFTSQAPRQDWAAPYNEACEEAVLLMAEYYLRKTPLSVDEADRGILALVEEETAMGMGIDVSVFDLKTLAQSAYGRSLRIVTGTPVTIDTLKSYIKQGYPVIVPVAGRELFNPNFTGSGPAYHMVLVIGFDTDNFIVHEPGTRNGNAYLYNQSLLINAIHDWAGSKENVYQGQKAIAILQ